MCAFPSVAGRASGSHAQDRNTMPNLSSVSSPANTAPVKDNPGAPMTIKMLLLYSKEKSIYPDDKPLRFTVGVKVKHKILTMSLCMRHLYNKSA